MSTVEEPAKLLRIATMLRGLHQQLSQENIDEPSRERLQEVHEAAVRQLRENISGPLEDELTTLSMQLEDDVSGPELRLAHAQLLGWLEGLLQGLQAAALGPQLPQGQRRPGPEDRPAPGQYL